MKSLTIIFVVVLISSTMAVNNNQKGYVQKTLSKTSQCDGGYDPIPEQPVQVVDTPVQVIEDPVETVQAIQPIMDTVTCILTVDNEMRYVSYNGQELQASGNYGSWGEAKTITFEADRCNPGKLEVRGFNYEGHPDGGNHASNPRDACLTGGLLVSCTAPEGTPWNEFGSNMLDWKAFGVSLPDTQAYHDQNNDDVPCKTTSGFSLAGNQYGEKIWGSTGEPEAIMIGGPSALDTCPVVVDQSVSVPAACVMPPTVVVVPDPAPIYDDITCILTVDNVMRYVKYEGDELQASGDYGNWGAVKTINFQAERCNPGRLEIRGWNAEADSCRTGGILVSCTAPAESGWYQFGSDFENWTAYGADDVDNNVSYHAQNSDNSPCQAVAGFSLNGNEFGQKIWASTGQAEAIMWGGPQPPSGC